MSRLKAVSDPLTAAAQWFARRRDGVSVRREQEQFEQWCDEDPAQAAAYADLDALWREIGEHTGDESIMALRREALALAPARAPRQWMPYAAAAAVVLALTGTIAMNRFGEPARTGSPATVVAAAGSHQAADAIYRTQVGERSVARLPDGSTAQLNTDTVIRVAYVADERRIELLRGEALFDVAHNPDRPFVVEAGADRVVALGTAFTVRRETASVEVTLLNGKVVVEREGGLFGRKRVATLSPGQQLTAPISGGGGIEIRQIDLGKVASWRGGFLSFDGEPLSKVVAEINRYTVRKIALADPSLGAMPVSGVFKTGSTDGIVVALQASFPVVRVDSGSDDRIVLDWAEGGKP